jgi:hypothetical protein
MAKDLVTPTLLQDRRSVFWSFRCPRPVGGGFTDRCVARFRTTIAPALIENEMRGSKKANIVAMLQNRRSMAIWLCQARPIHRNVEFAIIAGRDSVVFPFHAFSR